MGYILALAAGAALVYGYSKRTQIAAAYAKIKAKVQG